MMFQNDIFYRRTTTPACHDLTSRFLTAAYCTKRNFYTHTLRKGNGIWTNSIWFIGCTLNEQKNSKAIKNVAEFISDIQFRTF